MRDRIAIVGNGVSKQAIAAALSTNDFDIVTLNEAQEMLEATSFNPTNEPCILHKLPEIDPYPQQKQFICKGLHQYKNVNGEWICQCGTKL